MQFTMNPVREPPVELYRPRTPGILVADRVPSTRIVLRLTLSRQGFRVWTAGDAFETVRTFRQAAAEIDLLLLDSRLRGLEPRELMDALRLIRPGVRCCFMTDPDDPFSPDSLQDLGAVWTFPRPFPLAQVAEILWDLAHAPARPTTVKRELDL
jgi:CheY-like chemotaxis protein